MSDVTEMLGHFKVLRRDPSPAHKKKHGLKKNIQNIKTHSI